MTANKPKARWIKANGGEIEVIPKNGKNFEYQELQDFVRTDPMNRHCMIQIVPIHRTDQLLVCEEEAMWKNLPTNTTATVEFATDVYQGQKGIQGDVLVCDEGMIE